MTHTQLCSNNLEKAVNGDAWSYTHKIGADRVLNSSESFTNSECWTFGHTDIWPTFLQNITPDNWSAAKHLAQIRIRLQCSVLRGVVQCGRNMYT